MPAAGDGAGSLGKDGRLPSSRRAWQMLLRWSRIRSARQAAARASLTTTIRKVAVLGGGSFGTAMAAVFARGLGMAYVDVLVRKESQVEDINVRHENSQYLPGKALPHNVYASTDAASVLRDADIVVHAIPVQASAAALAAVRHLIPPTTPIYAASKGIDTATGELMSELIPRALGNPDQPVVFLSGPSFAVEIVSECPTSLCAASKDPGLARQAQLLLASDSLRINTSDDVVGVEVAGALKNVLAIAAGIVEGLELGNNAKAALVAQGFTEIRWLAKTMGAQDKTLSGLSGIGDIMLTCFTPLSRNRTVGVRLGQGEDIASILGSMGQVAEGVATAKSVVKLAQKYHVTLPVLTAVNEVIGGRVTAADAVRLIMTLPQVDER